MTTQFANHTCAVSSPPRVALPEGYRTYPISGTGTMGGDPDASNNTIYDLITRQVVPWVIAASFEKGESESKVICVTADSIQEKSRVPEGQ
ncbi:hypothetical protein GQ44DRAFT_694831 [Phaeosphaeriaceae sp. PMI808]|nr:hypothetical protein GQ44DRAFT_694831 [Phaeosphaeriaceae sp. PMI808]